MLITTDLSVCSVEKEIRIPLLGKHAEFGWSVPYMPASGNKDLFEVTFPGS